MAVKVSYLISNWIDSRIEDVRADMDARDLSSMSTDLLFRLLFKQWDGADLSLRVMLDLIPLEDEIEAALGNHGLHRTGNNWSFAKTPKPRARKSKAEAPADS